MAFDLDAPLPIGAAAAVAVGRGAVTTARIVFAAVHRLSSIPRPSASIEAASFAIVARQRRHVTLSGMRVGKGV